jgi:hypothetical protein
MSNPNAPNSPYYGMAIEDIVDVKCRRRMAMVDAYSPDVRALIHEYGLTVVKGFYDLGVKNPRHIRHLVEIVLNEFSPTRGTFSKQGKRTEVESHPNAAALDD